MKRSVPQDAPGDRCRPPGAPDYRMSNWKKQPSWNEPVELFAKGKKLKAEDEKTRQKERKLVQQSIAKLHG